jgi:hypothetical protein
VYQPEPLSVPTGTAAAALAEQALACRLTVYAGAGVSAAPPTSLPGAARLANLVFEVASAAVALDGVDRSDLVGVADRLATEPQGLAYLKSIILRVAELTGARINYAHEVLALLICEGAIVVIETNYDDCIERGALPVRLPVVITDEDRLTVSTAALLKAHGCATRPDTMLVTSAELEDPPLFARTELAARLSQGAVAFLGIGSPADYVKSSLKTFISKVASNKLVVIGPQVSLWDDSGWSDILPDLPEEQRIAATADAFSDALLRSYLQPILADVSARVAHMPEGHRQRAGLTTFIEAIATKDSVSVLRWLRAGSWRHQVGDHVARSPQTVHTLLALGVLCAGTRVDLRRNALALLTPPGSTSAVPLLVLQAEYAPRGTEAASEARMRVHDARADDRIPNGSDVIVLCSGHIGPLGEDEVEVPRGAALVDVLAAHAGDSTLAVMPDHLVDEPDAEHLLDSYNAGRIVMVNADALIEAA